MIDLPEGFWAELESRYRRPPRHYHTFAHVREMLRLYEQVQHDVTWQRPDEVYLAVLCHDAVYDVGREDNELRSAAFARQLIESWLHGALDVDRVVELILLTGRHGALRPCDVSIEQALFLDLDMAILGATPERFSEYERGIQAEYTELFADEQYQTGRTAFLRQLLASDRIFLSDYFHSRLEDDARSNIQSRLTALETGDDAGLR